MSDRERWILYDIIYIWNLKRKKKIESHRERDHICDYGTRGMRELDEGSQKAQTSSYKIDKYWGCNVQRDDYG